MKKLLIILTVIFILISFSACDMLDVYNLPLNPTFEHTTDELSVHFLDVGQADCQLILLPNGQTMLIDAGNNGDDTFICNYLDNLGIDKIDYLIGTHPHEDHIGAMDVVINNYDIGSVYMPDATADTKSFRDVKEAISTKNLSLTVTCAGMVLYDDGILKMETVAPVNYYDDLNSMSIVLRLTYKDASFLFTGDAEEESEDDISSDIEADVLSVGHHGSSTSTSDYFLQRVDPMYAVISCGEDNDYGHPHYETLQKLSDDDVTVYRTDTMGTIICTTKGEKGDYKWESIK